MARVMAVALDVMAAPFEWGTLDCCTASCNVFQRLYGIDPMRAVRGTYTTKRGALRLIARFGGMHQIAMAYFKREGLVPCEPREGALGVANGNLVICARPGMWFAKTLTGITTLPDAEIPHHVPL